MSKVYSFIDVVRALVILKDSENIGKRVCSTNPKHYASREGKVDDEEYCFMLGNNCASPLIKLGGGSFQIAPDDLDNGWVIKEI